MTPTHLTIGQAIRDRRISKGLSQVQLAKRTGYSRPVINHIEQGKTNFIFNTLVDICTALDMEVRECF